MKHLKMLGLAAIAALGLMAFAGTGIASATTLATDAAGTTHYEVGTEYDATLKAATAALLETTTGAKIALCTESTIGGQIEDPAIETAGKKYPSGTWVTGTIKALNWGGCEQGTFTVSTGSLEIMQTTGDAGEVRGKGTSVTLNVFGVSCTYGTSVEGTRLGTITGGASPELVINGVLPRVAGNEVLCPNGGRWTGTYIITSPHELHIVS